MIVALMQWGDRWLAKDGKPPTALVEDGAESVVFVQPDPKRLRYVQKRVAVVKRFGEQAYVRSRLTDKQKSAGLEPLTPGEWLLTGGAVELKAALEDVQAREKAKPAGENKDGDKKDR